MEERDQERQDQAESLDDELHQVVGADEQRHVPDGDELWNESYYLDLVADDGSLGGYVRLGFYPNLGVVWWTTAIVREGGPTIMSTAYDLTAAPTPALAAAGSGVDVMLSVLDALTSMRVEATAPGISYEDPADAYTATLREPPTGVKPGDLMFQRVLAEMNAGSLDSAQTVLDELGKDPAFDEGALGFSTFSKFLESAKDKAGISLQTDPRSGTYRVSLADAPAAAAALAADIESDTGDREARGGRRRRRVRRSSAAKASEEAEVTTEAPAEEAPAEEEKPKRRRAPAKKKVAEEAPAEEAASDAEAPAEEKPKRRRPPARKKADAAEGE